VADITDRQILRFTDEVARVSSPVIGDTVRWARRVIIRWDAMDVPNTVDKLRDNVKPLADGKALHAYMEVVRAIAEIPGSLAAIEALNPAIPDTPSAPVD
jgi:hypothetical protein